MTWTVGCSKRKGGASELIGDGAVPSSEKLDNVGCGIADAYLRNVEGVVASFKVEAHFEVVIEDFYIGEAFVIGHAALPAASGIVERSVFEIRLTP